MVVLPFLVARHATNGSTPAPPPLLFSSLGLIAGDPFIVMEGTTVLMDIDTPELGATNISGTVKPVELTDTHTFTTTSITVEDGGILEYGSEALPCNGPQIVLNGAYVPLVNTTIEGFTTPTTSNAANRGIMVMPGGRVDLHGYVPTTIWTTLNAHASLGATALTLATSPAWANGATVVVSPTDFVDYQNCEDFTLSGATAGTSATLSSGLAAARWGLLQYPTDSGMSTTPGTFSTKKASADVPTVLDQRARVSNLSRGLIISAPNDLDWQNKGHGCTIMAMASNGANQGILRMSGVQMRRAGIRGALGRYPIHWHMQSYTSAGVFTSNVSAGYAKKCVIWESENRGITIHGTCGVTLSDNITYKVKGHAYFLEDGSEQHNYLLRNMALKTMRPGDATALPAISSITGNGTIATIVFVSPHGLYSGQTIEVYNSSNTGYYAFRNPCTVLNATTVTYAATGSGAQSGATAYYGYDQIKAHDRDASGFWITNMANTIQDNYAAGTTKGSGMWCAMSDRCFGLSANVALQPSHIDPLSSTSFNGFTGHSNFGFGMNFRFVAIDEIGQTAAGDKFPQSALGEVESNDHRLWKNNTGAYANTTNRPIYRRWIVSDNGTNDWQGSTNNGGLASDHLGIAYSLNNAHTVPLDDLGGTANVYPHHAFVTYHGTIRFQNCSWFNYTYAPIFYWYAIDRGSGGGVLPGGTDFYDISGIDTIVGRSDGFKFYNSHPGPMVPPVHLSTQSVDNPGTNQNIRSSVACVWYDTDGKYGTAGKHMLPFTGGTSTVDDYFLTGATNLADGPTTGTAVCKTTDTKFHAFGSNDEGGWALTWSGTPVNGNITSGSMSDENPITVTRQVPATGVTIGTPFMVKRGDTGVSLGQYRNIPMQNGGRFQVDFSEKTAVTISNASPAVITYPNSASHGLTAGAAIVFSTTVALPTGLVAGTTYYVLAAGLANSTFRVSLTPGGAAVNTSSAGSGTHSYTFAIDIPTSMVIMDIFCANAELGDYMLLGIPWANSAAAPRVAFGSLFSNESVADTGRFHGPRTTFPSAADVTANKAIICNSTGMTSVADVLADTTGVKFWRDTTNNRVWVRYTNRNTVGGTLTANTTQFAVDVKTIVVKV